MARNKHLSYNDIPNLQADWAKDVTNENKPYAGESVQKFIKKTFNGKAGDFFYDADTSKCLVFADADARALYLSNRQEYASLLLGTFETLVDNDFMSEDEFDDLFYSIFEDD